MLQLRSLILGFALIGSSIEASATTFVGMPTVELASHADLILIGRVEAVASRWARDRIESVVTFAVDGDVDGRPARTITFTTPGGTVDGVAMRVHGGVPFRTGDRAVVMLAMRGNALRHVGLAEGKLAVLGTGAKSTIAIRSARGGGFEQVPLDVALVALRRAQRVRP